MVKPLSFKGDKPKSSKKRKHAHTHGAEPDSNSAAAPPSKLPRHSELEPTEATDPDASAEDQSWVSADTTTDISGPILICLPSDPPTAIASDIHGKVFASELENLIEGDIRTAEPHDVRQVWVATKVAGTEGFSLKGGHGRYLSCDKYGLFSATASAISAHESFLIHPSPDILGTFFMQTLGGSGENDTFVGIKDGAKGVEIRGDETSLSFQTTIRIRMQARFKPKIKASKETKAREKISRKELEELVGRRLDEDEVKRLRRARKAGNFHEEVLDVKVKGKHDKFA
ncbi:FRG1-like family-domain-containing protein [Aspergillus pseudoustus]|uniref:FRG1-like family-domain-containing protein n=1 Tax=Aspergillus pseudoustus TaxID=1810923 RepID=A0ABR4JMZ5_9EURO